MSKTGPRSLLVGLRPNLGGERTAKIRALNQHVTICKCATVGRAEIMEIAAAGSLVSPHTLLAQVLKVLKFVR
jgi:hypothetical protein